MSRPIRVAIVARSVFPLHGHGGLERHVYDLTRYLADAGLVVTLITRDPKRQSGAAPSVAGTAIHPRITLRTVPYRTFPFAGRRGTTVLDRSTAYPWFGERAGRVALDLVRRGEIDVVHGLGASVLGYARQRATQSAPLVMNPQGLEEFGATDPSRARLKRLAYLPLRRAVIACARAADRVIATDRSLEPAVRHHLGLAAHRIVTIPNAIDLRWLDGLATAADAARVRRSSGIGDEETVLLSVGRLEENKGFHVLAAALGALRDHTPVIAAGRWRWVIVGDGPYRGRLTQAIAAAGVAGRTLLAGRLDDATLHAWYEAAQVFVHPTLYEGSSLVTLEAMAHRRAVVATNAGGLPDKVETGHNGWLVPAGDASALAGAISGALGPDVDLPALGRHGRLRVEREFSWDAAAQSTIQLYRELLGRDANRHGDFCVVRCLWSARQPASRTHRPAVRHWLPGWLSEGRGTPRLSNFDLPSSMKPPLLFVVLSAAAATMLILRLGGVGLSWLPGPMALMAVLAGLVIVSRLRSARTPVAWRAFVRVHDFSIGLGLVVLLALIVRLPGLWSDLGHVPIDIDENRLASNVRHFFATGELRHETVEHYPGAVFWLFAGGSLLGYLRGLTSLGRGPTQLPVELFIESARLANVVVGAGIVFFTGLLGRRLFTPAAGLIAAGIVAVAPLSVDTTVLVRNDPGMVLVVMAAVYTAVVALDDPRRERWLMTSGALAGVAAGIKYSSVFAVAPPLIAAVAVGPFDARLRSAGRVVAAFVLAVAITNHFVWADFPNFLKQLADQVAITGRGHWAATDNPAAFYVAILERFGPGWPLLCLAAAFTVVGLCMARARQLVFLSFPVLYLWFMTQRPSQFPRWVFPLLPFVTIAGVGGLGTILALPRLAMSRFSMQRPYLARFTTIVVFLVALWPPLSAGMVAFSRRMTTPTHLLVETWVRAHVEPGAVVVVPLEWLDLTGSNGTIRRVPNLAVVLDAGLEQLSGVDWVIVPEINFGHPTLKRLGFVQRFHAEQSFAGNLGYDYEVYAVPRMPEAALTAGTAR